LICYGSIDAFIDIEDLCARSPNDTRCRPAEDLGDEGDKENDAAGVPTGGDGNNTPDNKPKPTEEDLRKEIRDQFTDLSASEVENFVNALLDIAQGSSANELTPSQRIELLQTVGSMVKDGSISNETVQYFAGLKNATPMGELCKVPGLEFNPNPSFVAGGGLPPGAGLTGAFAIAGTLVFATPGLPDEVIMLTGIAIGYGVGTLLSQKDDPLVNPMVVPGTVDFAGMPSPMSPKDPNEEKSKTRDLTADDLGVKGELTDLRGTYTTEGAKITIRVDMIEGNITNPLGVVNNLVSGARAQGASMLRVEGRLANEQLYNVLTRRYGLKSQGGIDFFEIPIK
jgi:hypothetical protein